MPEGIKLIISEPSMVEENGRIWHSLQAQTWQCWCVQAHVLNARRMVSSQALLEI